MTVAPFGSVWPDACVHSINAADKNRSPIKYLITSSATNRNYASVSASFIDVA
jgi:hypothetical protein